MGSARHDRRATDRTERGLAALVRALLSSRSHSRWRRNPAPLAVLVLAATALLVACGGSAATSTGTASSARGGTPDFATTFDIGGGRQMYLECHGVGSPTVVLVAGAVAAGDTWRYVADPSGTMKPSGTAVYPDVGRFTRVCAYDRPGTVRENDAVTPSTPVPQPTTPARDAADLHAVLSAANVSGPYVLAGWSYGGPVARLYASTYPRDVSGLVLVDATSEFLQGELTPAGFLLFLQLIHGDDEKRIAQWKDVERFDPVTAFTELRAAPAVPAMPVVVLSSDKFDPNAFRVRLPAGAPADFPDVFWKAQLASQDRLAGLFPGAQHIASTNSDHNIQNESPRLVTDAIRDVVQRATGR